MVEILKAQPLFAQQIGLLWDMNFFSSPNFSKRRSKIEAVVLHHTACTSVAQVLEIFTKKHSVSAHYLLSRQKEGKNGAVDIYNLVSDKHKAWHAGVSAFGCWEALNDSSVGIEIDNDGQDEPFENAQMAGLVVLLQGLRAAYDISPFAFLSHHEIAPHRKTDPSALFNWQLLAHYGIGYFPNVVGSQKVIAKQGDSGELVRRLQHSLYLLGYRYFDVDGEFGAATKSIISSFQRRYAPLEYRDMMLRGAWTERDVLIIEDLFAAKKLYAEGRLRIEICQQRAKEYNPLRAELAPYKEQLQQLGLAFLIECEEK